MASCYQSVKLSARFISNTDARHARSVHTALNEISNHIIPLCSWDSQISVKTCTEAELSRVKCQPCINFWRSVLKCHQCRHRLCNAGNKTALRLASLFGLVFHLLPNNREQRSTDQGGNRKLKPSVLLWLQKTTTAISRKSRKVQRLPCTCQLQKQ